jgi:hypothetical protein
MFREAGKDVVCPHDCARCDLAGTKCYVCDPPYEITDENLCVCPVDKGFRFKDGLCVPCQIGHCSVCEDFTRDSATYERCTTCFPSYTLIEGPNDDDDRCFKKQKPRTHKAGYYLNEFSKTFEPCNTGCAECFDRADKCTVCDDSTHALGFKYEVGSTDTTHPTCLCKGFEEMNEDGSCTLTATTNSNCILDIEGAC